MVEFDPSMSPEIFEREEILRDISYLHCRLTSKSVSGDNNLDRKRYDRLCRLPRSLEFTRGD